MLFRSGTGPFKFKEWVSGDHQTLVRNDDYWNKSAGGPYVDEVVIKDDNAQPSALYEFEPDPETVLDELLPRYIDHTVYTALLMSAASEHAARRRAMKSATDNAEEMIKSLSRQANQARQAEITQEISEIVGGADALSAAG